MARRPVRPLAALLAGLALLASACSLPDLTGPEPHDHQPAPPPARAARATHRKPAPTWATASPVRVVMNDRFRYRPSSIRVRAGRRVTFAVTNAGKLPHEFILGDRGTQLDHERQMQAATTATGHVHDHAAHGPPAATGALTVPPGQTRRPTWTFDKPGIVLYGCHVLGHWAAGMKGTIMVVSPDPP